MKLSSLWKAVILVVSSALLIVLVTGVGCFAFGLYVSHGGSGWATPVEEISATLVPGEKEYTFTGQNLLEGEWAMLLDETGRVVWSWEKPQELPEQYSLTEVASFSRWYLKDYPVRCWVRQDGLLVVGAAKGSIWKHQIYMETRDLLVSPIWFLGFFLLGLGSVLALAWGVVGRWFRQGQQVRDAARSGWINGVSHDIRTPLSVVMGYAAQLEQAGDIPSQYRQQAKAIRTQSQVIRDLVNDLNLTMRLDCAMEALRLEPLQPEVFLRQLAADFINGGMAEGFDFELVLPPRPLPAVQGDPHLLRRGINNLLANCVQHNPAGCTIRLGAEVQKKQLVFWVEGGSQSHEEAPLHNIQEDGGAAHGTGLKLVAQIAAAHKGKAVICTGPTFRSEIRIPVYK